MPFGTDREAIARELGFAGLMMSSLNGVGDRDVGYIASIILQRTWLVDAEKEMIRSCGRIYQSG